MNNCELEAIILNSAWQMIDGMVNWALFEKTDEVEPSNLLFRTNQHAQLFAILLGDFLAQVKQQRGNPIPLGLKSAPTHARPSNGTFLFHLRQVCNDPKLSGDTGPLSAAIEVFADWLEVEFVAEGVNLAGC